MANNRSTLVKLFFIGSSIAVLLPFFLAVQNIDDSVKNYSYQKYTLIAPIYLGLMSVLGYTLFGDQFWKTGLMSGIFVAIVATTLKSYNYSQQEWLRYYIYIVMKHMVVFGVIINYLSKI